MLMMIYPIWKFDFIVVFSPLIDYGQNVKFTVNFITFFNVLSLSISEQKSIRNPPFRSFCAAIHSFIHSSYA